MVREQIVFIIALVYANSFFFCYFFHPLLAVFSFFFYFNVNSSLVLACRVISVVQAPRAAGAFRPKRNSKSSDTSPRHSLPTFNISANNDSRNWQPMQEKRGDRQKERGKKTDCREKERESAVFNVTNI